MATTPRASTGRAREVDYPTSDGKPMGETDLHRRDMIDLIQALEDRFAADPMAYVSGNILLFYEEGNRRKHVSPDALVTLGIPKEPPRLYYLLWKEGKAPDVVVEVTSKTTRREDQKKKWVLYRDVLKVREYFQFDPTEDYLRPSMQGHRLVGDEYVPIALVEGRLPSEVLGLHLERDGTELRLYDPLAGRWLPTRQEAAEAARRAEREARRGEEAARREAEQSARRTAEVEAENARLMKEVEELRRRLGGGQG
jgi:Uma2 family endonuclease